MLEGLIARIARALGRRVGIHLARVVVRVPKGVRIESPICDVRCEALEISQLLLLCKDPALELTEQHVRSAFERGDICIGAYVGDRLVGYQWIAFGPTPHVAGLWVQIRPADCYFYRLFVHPNFRGLRIADALSADADKAAIALGRNRILGFINVQNTSSWKAIKRRGGWTAGYVGYVGWFRISIPFRTRGAVRKGFRFFNSQIPENAPLPWPS